MATSAWFTGVGAGTLSMAALLIAPAAAAQEAPADEVVYPAAYFQEFSPQTALDIVRRTPGFSLDEGENVRGFGGAAGNVLIDGARPSVKGGGLADFLDRIPAEQVQEVRLLRNAQTAEAQGQALVLNVIRRPVETSLAWELNLEQTGQADPLAFGSVTIAGGFAGWEGSLETSVFIDETPVRTRRVFEDAVGGLSASWAEDRVERFDQLAFSGDARRLIWGGDLALNASGRTETFGLNRNSRIYTARPVSGAPDLFAPFRQWEDEIGGELGADFTRPIGETELKIIALATYEHEEGAQIDERRTGAFALTQASLLTYEREALESILRSTLSWSAGDAWRFEAGGEIAFNRLDSRLAITRDVGAGPVPVPLVGANTVVEEVRADGFFTVAFQATDRLTLDAALAAETSEIAVSGDARNTQGFQFFKPRFAVGYDLGGGANLRLSAERVIGQLDFGDFAAGAGLFDGVSTAGNPALGPETRWVYTAGLDWRRDNGFALSLEAAYQDRQGVLEEVALPSGGFGIANAGDATVSSVSLTLEAPLGTLVPGGRLSFSASSRDSAFRDPLIGEERGLTGFFPGQIEVSFRHDPPGAPFSWGVSAAGPVTETVYRIDEIDTRDNSMGYSAFVETNAFLGLNARLNFRNLTTQRFQRERVRFDPDRAGVRDGTERRWAAIGMVVELELSGRF